LKRLLRFSAGNEKGRQPMRPRQRIGFCRYGVWGTCPSLPRPHSSSVKNFQVIDLESGNGVLGQLNLPEIGDAEGDSLQT
jgi:hypothetical protein